MKYEGIPCLFKFFNEFIFWKKGFAFLATSDKNEGRAYISLTNNHREVNWYCYNTNELVLGAVWIPDSPVLRELYDL